MFLPGVLVPHPATGGFLRTFLLSWFVGCILLTFTSPVAAAEVAADLERYCQENYGYDAFPNMDRRDNGLLCSRRTQGGVGLLHNKIQPEEVCAAQHGTRQFRREGTMELTCLTSATEEVSPKVTTVDLEIHCRETRGLDAFLTRRRTDNQPICAKRMASGASITFYPIDLSGLCGGATPRVEQNMLHCEEVARASSALSEQETTQLPKRRLDRGEMPTGHEPVPYDQTHVREQSEVAAEALRPVDGNLEGCWVNPLDLKTDFDWMAMTHGDTIFSCPELTGGWAVDLNGWCKSMFGGDGAESYLEWKGDLPGCRSRRQRPEGHVDWDNWIQFDFSLTCVSSWSNITGIGVDASSEAYNALLAENGLAFRWNDKKLQCFWVPIESIRCYRAFLSEGKYPPECVRVVEVHFTQSEPPYDEIEDLTIGQPFRVKVVFNSDPHRDKEPVTVTNERTGKHIKVLAEQQVGNPKIFRTPPIELLPEVQP